MKYSFYSKFIFIKNVKKIFFKYANCILYIIAYELYYLSLEGCFDGEEICGNIVYKINFK